MEVGVVVVVTAEVDREWVWPHVYWFSIGSSNHQLLAGSEFWKCTRVQADAP